MDKDKELVGGASLLRRTGLVLLGYALAFLVYCLGMIKGWGLPPKDWTWIVLCGFLGPAFMRAFTFAFGSELKGRDGK
jgi:hypothetical protein